MLHSLITAFFGCAHPRTTFPITVTRQASANDEKVRRTYVACLDCGAELAYNWQKMQTEGRSREAVAVPAAEASREQESSVLARLLHVSHRRSTHLPTAAGHR
jgi:hypothetical protein